MNTILLAVGIVAGIGLLIGLICWALSAICAGLGSPAIFRAALLCAAPVIITGGIHLDGYADTCDALASHADRQKKLENLFPLMYNR